MIDTPLPDKPSELLALALADLELCEKDEDYKVYMYDWHLPIDQCCIVCLAGSVIAKTMNLDKKCEFNPVLDIPNPNRNKLIAINHFRTGKIIDALLCLGIVPPLSLPYSLGVIAYENGETQFKQDMRIIIGMLEKEGL